MQVKAMIKDGDLRFKFLTSSHKEGIFIQNIAHMCSSFEGLWSLLDLCIYQSNVIDISPEACIIPASLLKDLPLEDKSSYMAICHNEIHNTLLIPINQLTYVIHRIGTCLQGFYSAEQEDDIMQLDNHLVPFYISKEQILSIPVHFNNSTETAPSSTTYH